MLSTQRHFLGSFPGWAAMLALSLLAALLCAAQPPANPSGARGVIRLRVKLKIGDATKSLSRKRFFLVKGSLEQNKALIEKMMRVQTQTRDCYYRGLASSSQLIRWLKDGDCESVYCREIQPEDIEGPKAVPEFTTAFKLGEQEFASRELARKWLTTNLPDQLRDGFYKSLQREIEALLGQARTVSGAPVQSVMTDRNGTAYFTDLEPGTYTLSNLLPTELDSTAISWNCEVQVKAGDLVSEKERPFTISNRKDRNVKCVGEERPLPVCDVMQTNGGPQ
jgi:hypothetical protein